MSVEGIFTRAGLRSAELARINALRPRERRRVAQILLGVTQGVLGEPLRVRILRSDLPEDVKAQLFRQNVSEDEKLKNKTELLLRLPLRDRVAEPPGEMTEFLAEARRDMDAVLVGQEALKLRVLGMLACWKNSGATSPFALALEGPAGSGKTSFVTQALAKVLRRPCRLIGLGGASDASFLLGHSYCYEGSKPGQLVEALVASRVPNPLVFFDEVDKLADSAHGDALANVLMAVTDPTQNGQFRDRYLQELALDLSGCVFVFSMNDRSRVHPVLLDRLKCVRVEAPTLDEKRRILTERMLPRAFARVNAAFEVSDAAVDELMKVAHAGGGMRALEKLVDDAVAHAVLLRHTVGGGDVRIDSTVVRAARQDAPKADAGPPPPPMMYS